MAIDMLRMKRVIGPPRPTFGDPSSEFNDAVTFPVQEETEQQYQPAPSYSPDKFENTNLKRFMDMAVPERTEPNLISKIGGVMMSATKSPEDVDKAVNARYYGKIADYQNQVANTLKAAEIEGQQEQYRGLNDYRRGQLQLGARRAATGETNAATSRLRANTAADLADNPSVSVKVGQNGQDDIWYDRKSGREIRRTPSGGLSPQKQYEMEQDGRLELADANNRASMLRTLTGAASSERIAGMPARAQNPEALSPTQRNAQVEGRAQELARIKPEWKDYITFDPQRGVEVKESSEPWFNWMPRNSPTQEERADILEYLKTGVLPVRTPQQQAPQPQSNNIPPTGNPGGVPMTGADHRANQTPIGGENPEFPPVIANTGYGPTPGQGVKLSRPPGDVNNPMGTQDKRARAIQILQQNKKVVNEQTIQQVMSRMQ